MATRRTLVKSLAAIAKKVAEPPSTSGASPKGVLTESKATVPITTIGLICFLLQIFPDEKFQVFQRSPRDMLLLCYHSVGKGSGAFASAGDGKRADSFAQDLAGVLEGLHEICNHILDSDDLLRFVPAIVIRNQRHGAVADLRF